jgi:hypothetical protein
VERSKAGGQPVKSSFQAQGRNPGLDFAKRQPGRKPLCSAQLPMESG